MTYWARTKQKLFPIKGLIAVSLMKLIYWLPNRFSRYLGSVVGVLAFHLSATRRRIIMTNLRIAFPDMPASELELLAKQSSAASGRLLAEFPNAWYADRQEIEQQITEVVGKKFIESYSENNQPVIIVTPHIGNWEFLVQWVQINFPMFGLYTSSPIPQLDRLILNARSKFGCQPYPANNRGVLNLLRKLKTGGIMVILPDQVPKQGAGIYAPFFGQPAYTMTLLHKMIQKTNAKLLFAFCIRNHPQAGFKLIVEAPLFDDQQADVELFNTALNGQIETIIRRYPEQYVWDYKRFKIQADGAQLYAKKN